MLYSDALFGNFWCGSGLVKNSLGAFGNNKSGSELTALFHN